MPRSDDRQLQNTIGGFARTEGVVKKIDGTFRDPKDAIKNGMRIVLACLKMSFAAAPVSGEFQTDDERTRPSKVPMALYRSGRRSRKTPQ